MSESFADLFEESLEQVNMTPGSIITGTVVGIENDFVVVTAGLKSDGVIPIDQFKNAAGELEVAVGDEVQVALESLEDGFGETKLSRERAKRAEAWAVLAKAYEAGETVTGRISGRVRGGLTVMVNGINAFLPGSLVDTRPLRDTSHLDDQDLELKIVKLDEKSNNIVVSRRAILEEANSEEREKLLEQMEEGATLKGIVKNLTDYGAFIDLGGIDGLLHITDISWKRIKHPSEMLNVGDEIDVKVLRYDQERKRVSLGMKQLAADPWTTAIENYTVGQRVTAKVTKLADYGCFAQIGEGVEGLVHVSEMDWTNRNIHPSKVVQVGDEVEVQILDIDQQRRRISLGIKQCRENPWNAFASSTNKGDKVSGTVRSITDFGIFIGLDGGVDGLVHLSDISWDESGEEAVKRFNKGDTVEAVIQQVDAERERISLSIKALASDPFSSFAEANGKGSKVTGTVVAVDARQAEIEVAEGLNAILKVAEFARERTEDLSAELSVGDSVEAIVINVDRRNRSIFLSVKAIEAKEQQEALKAVQSAPKDMDVGATTIGDLIKEQMGKKE
ncbi:MULTISPECIES: 30S ribosomal protein S1 [unclassified Marinobacterium]|jgi:small subunit ribosomal protein S1|uniref:30S ribosomal protein S1 n=1 Tax=unclassified Marinobacterium TaxID=2644139 RepID=UPI001568A125|nr:MULTISPECIES: 30S ribosomal protein S1 [unclassified Marinobacterium]NRP15626.1 30S ribosomal protein S1 [Marinobacterium sp. xm-a-152]NRP38260.1 30S ribosomal protein S1 [Marinobacterium sp. xm-a-121]NRP95175.1 30S ribosomal protein S1 [Marinobacterium sp. xm-g-59]NRP98724.1 30S ribosomal protein S1 [Marinobacterium sp. xm-v-233]NRQ02418.1 30S ribosomal protein S1 [Marinobacterium sp. xm-d-530]